MSSPPISPIPPALTSSPVPPGQPPELGVWLGMLNRMEFEPIEKTLAAAPDDPVSGAGEFVRQLYKSAMEFEDADIESQLIRTLRDYDPRATHAQLQQMYAQAQGPYRVVTESLIGKERFTRAMGVLEKLASPSGLAWIVIAHAACLYAEKGIAEESAHGERAMGEESTPNSNPFESDEPMI